MLRKTMYIGLVAIFILLFSSAFVGVKFGLLYTNIFSFMSLRFLMAGVLFLIIAVVSKSSWPKSNFEVIKIIANGLLISLIMTSGIWLAISMGFDPGLSALVISMQPILVAFISRVFLNTHIDRIQWLGFIVSLCGIGFTVIHGFSVNQHFILSILLVVTSLLSLSGGTILQKKYTADMNLFSGGAIQSFSCALVATIVGIYFHGLYFTLSPIFLLTLAWMVVAVSVGAVTILFILIRSNSAHQVASLFYFLPLIALVESHVFLHTPITKYAVLGALITIVGVLMVKQSKGINKVFSRTTVL